MPDPSDHPFLPAPDTAAILGALLDVYERRTLRPRTAPGGSAAARQAIRIRLTDLDLPGYFDQSDPHPRRATNEQLAHCAREGWLRLTWRALAQGELLDRVTLAEDPPPAGEAAAALFRLLGRTPEAARRAGLAETILAERFRFAPGDWRRRAVDDVLAQLAAGRSPAPFDPRDLDLADDLLAALAALDGLTEETPFRAFSVRLYSDSKRFEAIRGPLATLARRMHPEWRGWTADEALRELRLVPNPSHLFMFGDWELVDAAGRVLHLGNFDPAAGVPARQVDTLVSVRAGAARVICVENLTSFYSLVAAIGNRGSTAAMGDRGDIAALCLAGNPAPATRRLLRLLDRDRPAGQAILAWNDIDYGGLNILSQLRRRVSAEIAPLYMDRATLDTHARWARPLGAGDRQNLVRLRGRPELADLHALVDHMLARGLKLEQEAIEPAGLS
jgi:hypothetical protein